MIKHISFETEVSYNDKEYLAEIEAVCDLGLSGNDTTPDDNVEVTDLSVFIWPDEGRYIDITDTLTLNERAAIERKAIEAAKEFYED